MTNFQYLIFCSSFSCFIFYVKRYKAWCLNTVGSYHCHCPPGFYYDEANKWCEGKKLSILKRIHS